MNLNKLKDLAVDAAKKAGFFLIENKVKETLISAYKILEDGGSSMDAVEFAVSEFEDST